MLTNTEIWLERLNALYKSQMRQAVSAEGLLFVHYEILQYLAICNRYSNTAIAISEYLGQTKGSISQSLKAMEELGLIKRQTSPEDKRVTKLIVTKKGKQYLKAVSKSSGLSHIEDVKVTNAIKDILSRWQTSNDKQGFGQCRSCIYNQTKKSGELVCGLVNESISTEDSKKICREHRFNETE